MGLGYYSRAQRLREGAQKVVIIFMFYEYHTKPILNSGGFFSTINRRKPLYLVGSWSEACS